MGEEGDRERRPGTRLAWKTEEGAVSQGAQAASGRRKTSRQAPQGRSARPLSAGCATPCRASDLQDCKTIDACGLRHHV